MTTLAATGGPAEPFNGRVALVTGGSRGIGLAIARSYVDGGGRVMLCSRKIESLKAAAAAFPEGTVEIFAANVGDEEGARSCMESTVDRLGTINALVNNAATNPYFGPLTGAQRGQIDKTIQVNQIGPLLWAQLAWDAGMKEYGGVILNISSIGSLSVAEGLGIYGSTKAALNYLTRQLAWELGPKVRVVGIAPGLVATDMARAKMEKGTGMETTESGDGYAGKLPLRRIGRPSDIAELASFLLSDAASWITGETIVIDGGASARPISE